MVTLSASSPLIKMLNEIKGTSPIFSQGAPPAYSGACLHILNRCEDLQRMAGKPDKVVSQSQCRSLLKKCQVRGPFIPKIHPEYPNYGREGEPLHDVLGFYEVSDVLLNHYLPSPTTTPPDPTFNILYPCSGNHVAVFEIVFQLLERTAYERVHLTFTEIYANNLSEIWHHLSQMGDHNLKFRLEVGDESPTHRETDFIGTYRTRKNEQKSIRMTFVLGKPDSAGRYPPYFRFKEDYEPAHLIIVFDAEDSAETLRQLDEARASFTGSAAVDKIMIMENRPAYRQWADRTGHHKVVDGLSQHFGCEDTEKATGGLRPMIFKVQHHKDD